MKKLLTALAGTEKGRRRLAVIVTAVMLLVAIIVLTITLGDSGDEPTESEAFQSLLADFDSGRLNYRDTFQ